MTYYKTAFRYDFCNLREMHTSVLVLPQFLLRRSECNTNSLILVTESGKVSESEASNISAVKMVIPTGSTCIKHENKMNDFSPNHPQRDENRVHSCPDYEYTSSSPSYLIAIGSTNEINVPVDFKYKPNFAVDQKKNELRQIVSDLRTNCCKHLDNIDSLINNQFNKSGQELSNKNFLLQNELIIQKKISETKDEIQKLRCSIYNQAVEEMKYSQYLKAVYLVIILVLCVYIFMMVGQQLWL